MSRTRNFLFTINNYTEQDEQLIRDIPCRWIIAAKEVAPSTGTPHLQCAIVVPSPTSIRALSRSLPRASIRVMDGTPEQNRTYCSKSDTAPYERGECPISNSAKGNKEKRRWDDAFTAVQEGRLEDVPKDILCTKLKSVEYAVQRVQQSKTDLSILTEWQHEWRYGSSGTGKSETARLENPGAFIKDPQTVWWDGYKGEACVIIDDFDKYQVAQGGMMKRWLDKYPFQAQVKGGYITIRPRKVVVTSNYTIQEIWPEDKTLEPILRRVKIIHHVPWLISGSSGGSKSKNIGSPGRDERVEPRRAVGDNEI